MRVGVNYSVQFRPVRSGRREILIGRGDHASVTELIDENPALVAGFFNWSRAARKNSAAFVFAAAAPAHGNPLKAAAEPPARTSFRT